MKYGMVWHGMVWVKSSNQAVKQSIYHLVLLNKLTDDRGTALHYTALVGRDLELTRRNTLLLLLSPFIQVEEVSGGGEHTSTRNCVKSPSLANQA